MYQAGDVSIADRIGFLLGALGAAVTAYLVRDLGEMFVMSGTWLRDFCLALGAVSLVSALQPPSMPRVEALLTVLRAGVRLAVPMALTLGWYIDGRELWPAVAMLVALQDAGSAPVRRWPLAPAAVASAIVIAWSATEPRVAPGRAVLVALICASAAAWGADRVSAPGPDR